MAKAFQRSFAGGEISPSLYARTDLVKYATGARTIRNAYVGRQGGAYNRPGTLFDTAAYNSASAIRLVPFDLPDGVHYQLEFGDLYMRPLLNWKPIAISSRLIYTISKAASAVVTLKEWNSFKVGEAVTFTGVVGMTQINGLTGTITAVNIGLSTITVNINSTGFSSYVSGGSVALVTPRNVIFDSPFYEEELFEMTIQQQGSTMTFAHENHVPVTLLYNDAQSWIFGAASTSPTIGTVTGLATSGAAGTTVYWAVSGVNTQTGEEGFPQTASSSAAPSSGSPITLTWTAVPGATSYNIYRGVAGSYGFVDSSFTNKYIDKGLTEPDYADQPTQYRDERNFTASAYGPRPSAVGFYQQRQLYGNMGPAFYTDPLGLVLPASIAYADRILMSRIGAFTFFDQDVPTADDSPISFRLLNRKPQVVRHFLDIGGLIVFTEQGEWFIKGDSDGAITPSQINPKLSSQNGSGYVPPIPFQNFALYVQRGVTSTVRSLGFELSIEGYRGDELTINSSHLVENNPIVSWDVQYAPHPIVWAALQDGTMAALTFVPEEAIVAWHRHDMTNGLIECVIKSNDQIGFVVKRTIGGLTVRHIEHFSERDYTDIKDAVFMDAAITWDGRNPDESHKLTISGGTTWDEDEILTVTASTSTFILGDVGKAVHITGPAGEFIRMTITAYTSGTVISAVPIGTVPVGLRGVATGIWALATKTVPGLAHLEGQNVSIIGDGFVLASPNNPAYDLVTVSSGAVDLGDTAYSVIHVGLPFISDVETLNLDNPGGESLVDKKKLITKVTAWVESTRGLFIGSIPPDDVDDPTKNLKSPTFSELKYRYEEGYNEPGRPMTRAISVNIAGNFNSNGRVILRQVDPLPMGILAIAPDGFIAAGGGQG